MPDRKERDAPERSFRRGETALHVACLLTVMIAGGLYVWRTLDWGWWPNNGGAFALSAERVLQGEVPHRDFDEIYTGGATYLHALALDVFGTNMASIRRALFLFFLAWIPSVYYIATRFAPPLVAALASLLAVMWSLPYYSEPIASWYNLFFATHGTAALLRWFETARTRWLFLVGVSAGLSLLAKIIGVYFVMAALLALLFHEQQRRGRVAGIGGASRPLAIAYAVALALGVCACALSIARFVWHWHGLAGVVHFAMPIAVLAALIVRNEVVGPLASASSRFREHLRRVVPIVLGVAVPIVPFLVPYLLSDSLGDLLRGLFVDPRKRLSVTTLAPPMMPLFAVPVVVLLVWVPRWPRIPALVLAAALGVSAAALLLSPPTIETYSAVIDSVRMVAPAAVIAGCVTLLLPRALHDSRAPLVYASLAATGFCSLVQFPVASTIYMAFVVPLGVLALLACFDRVPGAARAPLVIVLAAYVVMSVPLAARLQADQMELLELERSGGIRVSRDDKRQYEALVGIVRSLAKGEFIFATPDCPEVYFLTGFKNPTRTSYDFFDDPNGRTERIKEALAQRDVRLVVINTRPQFSDPPPPPLMEHLVREYPQTIAVGSFVVRWRP